MRIVAIVLGDPSFQGCEELFVAVPFLEPDEIFFESQEHTFGIGIAFGVIEGGKDLLYAQHTACGHKV